MGCFNSPEATREKLGLESGQQFHFPSGKHWVCLLLDLDPVADVVFPALHGPFGRMGQFRGRWKFSISLRWRWCGGFSGRPEQDP